MPTAEAVGRTVALGAALCVAAVVSLPVAPASGSPATAASCGWSAPLSADTRNTLFIDAAATYWTAAVPIPPGGHLEVAGTFPDARYLSLMTYDARGRTIDHLVDADIDPDPGSVNPFRSEPAGRDRPRRYTVEVHAGPPEAGSTRPNVLATEDRSGTRTSGRSALLTLRVYLPDDSADPTGGVGLPSVASVDADGRRTVHQACTDTTTTAPGVGLRVPGGRGQDPPAWSRFSPDGLGENPDNAYVYETFMPSLGPVLTLQAKAPSVALRADEGGQLRYWSLCSNLLTTAVHRCLADDEVPVADDGTWTIVVSRAADRPANAIPACGVAWLEAPPNEDSILVYRHMLPDPSFEQAIQQVEAGREPEQMADYYPEGRYETVAEHEALGCEDATGSGEDDAGHDDAAAADRPPAASPPSSVGPVWIGAGAVVVAGAGAGAVGWGRRRRHRAASRA